MAEISVTLKAGAGYADPWIVVKGESTSEVSEAIKELRDLGAFSSVRQIAREFAQAPDTPEGVIHQVFPGAVEVPEAGPTRAGSSGGSVTTTTSGQAGASSAAPPKQSPPACSKCGAATKPKSGMGKNGPYSGFACTADRTHFDLIK